MKTRQKKREQARDRQAVYDTLTTAEKVTRAKSRRGASAREIARLHTKEG